jgi:outer membrane protein assembly factor BamB
MLSLSLSLALAASVSVPPGPVGPDTRTSLPPAPVELYRVAWQRRLVPPQALETGPQEHGAVAVDPQRGLAVVGTRDGWLHAFRPDGTIAWELKAAGRFGPPTIEGDTVYVGSSDGNLYAVAIPTGKARWTYAAKEDLSTRPTLAGGLVVVASLQDTVFAIDAATGAWRWHHRREQKGEGLTIYGAASVAAAAGLVFAGYSDGFVAALDVGTGAARWERQVAPGGTHLDVDAIAVDGDRLYAAAYSGAVVAVEARTGKELWSATAPGACRVVVGGGFVFAVTSTNVVALAPLNGAPLWTTPLDGAPGAQPALAGKWLLVPAGPGGLRWLEAATGRPLRRFEPGTGVLAGPGVGAGRVYVLSNGGDLFALDLG